MALGEEGLDENGRRMLLYVDVLASRAERSEKSGDGEDAVKYYMLAKRHLVSWLEIAHTESGEFKRRQAQLKHIIDTKAGLESRRLCEMVYQDKQVRSKDADFLKRYKADLERQSMSTHKKKNASKREPWRPTGTVRKHSYNARKVMRRSKPKIGLPEEEDIDKDLVAAVVASPEAAFKSLDGGVPVDDDIQKLLNEKDTQIKMLKAQLEAAGQQVHTEIVSLAEAKERLRCAVAAAMGEATDHKIKDPENEMERWSNYISNHPEEIEAIEKERLEWIERNAPICEEALRFLKSFVPEDVFLNGTSKESLISCGLSPPLASRIYSIPALWLVRADDKFLARIHDADLRTKYSYKAVDFFELRALWAKVRTLVFENDGNKRKSEWRDGILARLKQNDNASTPQKRHNAYTSNDELGPFDPAAESPAIMPASVDREDALSSSLTSMTTQQKNEDDTKKEEEDGPQRNESLVDLAKSRLRQSSRSFADIDDTHSTKSIPSPVKRANIERRRSATGLPSAAGCAGLLAELKSSLELRRSKSVIAHADESKAETTPPETKEDEHKTTFLSPKAATKPPAPFPKAAAAGPPVLSFAEELARAAAKRKQKN